MGARHQCYWRSVSHRAVNDNYRSDPKVPISSRSRAPAAELPTTAALMGGIVAQEVIKVITKQYIPIDGVCAVDLVSSTTGTVKV